MVFSDGRAEDSERRIVDVVTLNVAHRSSITAIGGRIFTDLRHENKGEVIATLIKQELCQRLVLFEFNQ